MEFRKLGVMPLRDLRLLIGCGFDQNLLSWLVAFAKSCLRCVFQASLILHSAINQNHSLHAANHLEPRVTIRDHKSSYSTRGLGVVALRRL